MAEHEMHVQMPGDQGRTTRVPVDYPSNSKRSRQAPRTARPEPKKVEKIVTGRVIRKRKGLYERVGHSLFAEDSVSSGLCTERSGPSRGLTGRAGTPLTTG
jgi:hypothetical protein